MPVMTISASSIEEQIEEMRRKLAEKDAQIASLSAQVASQARLSKQKQVTTNEEGQSGTSNPNGAINISLEEIREMIAQGIREYQISQNPPIIGYTKPYPAHFDVVPFPLGYQRPNFDKFDGTHGSPHEHLAHFYSACGETILSDALLIRQFVQSLNGSDFTWYTQLQPGSIQTWGELQKAFLAQFVSTKAKVSIIDLASTHQRLDESSNDFITRWRSLRLQCPEKLSELACVQMCTNNLLPELAVHVGSVEPLSFNALVSKACNVERQLARCKTKLTWSNTNDGDGSEYEDESMTISIGESDQFSNKSKVKEPTKRLTLQERKQKKYSFDDDDVHGIFDELMVTKALTLPDPKRPNEVAMTDDPKYCPYHRNVGHPIQDCYVLKDVIEGLIDEGVIEIEGANLNGPYASSNTISLLGDVEALSSTPKIFDEIPFNLQVG